MSVGLIGGTILWLLTGKLVWLILGFCFSPLLGVAIWRGGDRGQATPGDAADAGEMSSS